MSPVGVLPCPPQPLPFQIHSGLLSDLDETTEGRSLGLPAGNTNLERVPDCQRDSAHRGSRRSQEAGRPSSNPKDDDGVGGGGQGREELGNGHRHFGRAVGTSDVCHMRNWLCSHAPEDLGRPRGEHGPNGSLTCPHDARGGLASE